MVAEPPSLHAVPSRGRILEFLRPQVHFGPFLANLAFCFNSFK